MGWDSRGYRCRHPCNKITKLLHLLKSHTPKNALDLSPVGSSWNGQMFSTIQDDKDTNDVKKLFQRWQPLVAILGFLSCLTRGQYLRYTKAMTDSSSMNSEYQPLSLRVKYSGVCGMTTSIWRFLYIYPDSRNRARQQRRAL